jgi:general stress protein 26
MSTSNEQAAADREKIWSLIKKARSALLVTVGPDGSIDSRPMGCIQSHFDDTLWFLTFRHSAKLDEIRADDRVLVSYAQPSEFEYVSFSGHAALVEDKPKVRELWFEGLRVWFPKGPDDPAIALIAVRVDEVKYWTNGASIATYAWAYIRARLTGQGPSPEEIAEVKAIHFD